MEYRQLGRSGLRVSSLTLGTMTSLATFLIVIGVPISYTALFTRWVDKFFGGLGGDVTGAEGMATALTECASSALSSSTTTGREDHREGCVSAYPSWI